LDVILPILGRAVPDCVAHVLEGTRISTSSPEFIKSAEGHAFKKEIVCTGKEFRGRKYVDGTCGNTTARISSRWIIRMPTMIRKADLAINDNALVDLESNQGCGDRPRNGEMLPHLEIYKAALQTKAVIYCHPPHATLHAVAGLISQSSLLPENQVFVGQVPLTLFEMPGTFELTRTVLPVAKKHSTILFQNHRVAGWADTVPRVEWLTGVINICCKTTVIAGHSRAALKDIRHEKTADLLAIKRRLGLADARYRDTPGAIENGDRAQIGGREPLSGTPSEEDIEQFVNSLPHRVISFNKGA
jgi:L-fuculose-phosphate aldolase